MFRLGRLIQVSDCPLYLPVYHSDQVRIHQPCLQRQRRRLDSSEKSRLRLSSLAGSLRASAIRYCKTCSTYVLQPPMDLALTSAGMWAFA